MQVLQLNFPPLVVTLVANSDANTGTYMASCTSRGLGGFTAAVYSSHTVL